MTNRSRSYKRLTRREFLMVSAASLAALAVSCNRSRDRTPFSSQPTSPTQSVSSAPPPDPLLYQTAPPPPPGGTPDLVLRNGKVLTVDATDSLAEAVAIKDGHIQAVGSNQTIDALQGAETQVIDLAGRTLTPGLIDPHYHLATVSLLNTWVRFKYDEINTVPAMQRKSMFNNIISPDQAITFMEALRAHTLGGAYAGFDEGLKGSIEPGKLADLAVWQKDPTVMSAEELSSALIDLTFVGGKQVSPG